MLDRFKITPKGQLILLEDIPKQVRLTDKIWAAAVARLMPIPLLPAFVPGLKNESLDATATVIFTSGSTADPKGVVLSHRNILSNIHQVEEHVHLKPDEVLLGILPFFHAFGFTITIWAGLCLGKKIVYHFNPLDARTVGKLCDEHGVTLLIGTPSFMRLYLKSCEPRQFRTITHLLLGAEKLKPELARDIKNALQIDPVEGYGCTELSPVVSVNVPNEIVMPDGRKIERQSPGHGRSASAGHGRQDDRPRHGRRSSRGRRRGDRRQGTAGDGRLPESSRGDGPGQEGRLVLDRRPGLCRLRRFPEDHRPAQQVLQDRRRDGAAPGSRSRRSWKRPASTSITWLSPAFPIQSTANAFASIYTDLGMSPVQLHQRLTAGPIPKVWIPSQRDFIHVDEIPITSTGKVDLRRLKQIALEHASSHNLTAP